MMSGTTAPLERVATPDRDRFTPAPNGNELPLADVTIRHHHDVTNTASRYVGMDHRANVVTSVGDAVREGHLSIPDAHRLMRDYDTAASDAAKQSLQHLARVNPKSLELLEAHAETAAFLLTGVSLSREVTRAFVERELGPAHASAVMSAYDGLLEKGGFTRDTANLAKERPAQEAASSDVVDTLEKVGKIVETVGKVLDVPRRVGEAAGGAAGDAAGGFLKGIAPGLTTFLVQVVPAAFYSAARSINGFVRGLFGVGQQPDHSTARDTPE